MDLTYFTYGIDYFSRAAKGLRKAAMEKELFKKYNPHVRYPKYVNRNVFIWKLLIIIKILKSDLKWARNELRAQLSEVTKLKSQLETLQKQSRNTIDSSTQENV
ncbi:hypothetical protein EHR05_14845 [Leptospira licerasiae]|nr:hypothetical protein EHR05_14845 [Leptospira licerasiae]